MYAHLCENRIMLRPLRPQAPFMATTVSAQSLPRPDDRSASPRAVLFGWRILLSDKYLLDTLPRVCMMCMHALLAPQTRPALVHSVHACCIKAHVHLSVLSTAALPAGGAGAPTKHLTAPMHWCPICMPVTTSSLYFAALRKHKPQAHAFERDRMHIRRKHGFGEHWGYAPLATAATVSCQRVVRVRATTMTLPQCHAAALQPHHTGGGDRRSATPPRRESARARARAARRMRVCLHSL